MVVPPHSNLLVILLPKRQEMYITRKGLLYASLTRNGMGCLRQYNINDNGVEISKAPVIASRTGVHVSVRGR